MRFLYFRNSSRRNRDNVGPLLNLVRVGVYRSETLYVLSASVTTGKISQAFVL